LKRVSAMAASPINASIIDALMNPYMGVNLSKEEISKISGKMRPITSFLNIYSEMHLPQS
jgi:hypothetical protein